MKKTITIDPGGWAVRVAACKIAALVALGELWGHAGHGATLSHLLASSVQTVFVTYWTARLTHRWWHQARVTFNVHVGNDT